MGAVNFGQAKLVKKYYTIGYQDNRFGIDADDMQGNIEWVTRDANNYEEWFNYNARQGEIEVLIQGAITVEYGYYEGARFDVEIEVCFSGPGQLETGICDWNINDYEDMQLMRSQLAESVSKAFANEVIKNCKAAIAEIEANIAAEDVDVYKYWNGYCGLSN